MSRRNILNPYIVADNLSLEANFNSEVTELKGLDKVTYTVQWTDAGNGDDGVFGVEVRQKVGSDNDAFYTEWVSLNFGADPNLNDPIDPTVTLTDGDHLLCFENQGFSQSRLVYSQTNASDGFFTATVSGSSEGA